MYARYDESTFCMPVMMRGPTVCQYDEGAYCMAVMMRGRIAWQL